MAFFSLKAYFFKTLDLQEKLNLEPLNKKPACTSLNIAVYELEVMQITTDVLTDNYRN